MSKRHAALEKLLGHLPFPWQARLLDRFCEGALPQGIDIPTGLGKTSIIGIWTVACALGANIPRRLVYVVDRRTVVDQATDEAHRVNEKITTGTDDVLLELRRGLGLRSGDPIAISMLRGQQPDNRLWFADPARPAIILGTVDMIGSRLLFEGYGASRKMRPYQAGLLGHDTLVVLDEAHLVPPFAALITRIAAADPDLRPDAGLPPMKMISLSATLRGGDANTFGLEAEDIKNEIVSQRIQARKRIRLHEQVATNVLAQSLVDHALARASGARHPRILIFCNSRREALKVKKLLPKGSLAELLVGERRVRERDALREWIVKRGFAAGSAACAEGAAFLVATSAGEVGIDLDADHMVCDLVAWERMVQRFGRVNRRGAGDAWIDIVPEATKEAGAEEMAVDPRVACADLLARLAVVPDGGGKDASPQALTNLRAVVGDEAISAASTPSPLRPALTRALLDAWSFTSLLDHPGRPEIGPWLRGWVDQEQQTSVIWRQHLPWRDGESQPVAKEVADFFEAAAPQRQEILEARSWDVLEVLQHRAKQWGGSLQAPALLVLSAAGDMASCLTIGALREFKRDRAAQQFTDRTLVVAAALGGLSADGLLDSTADDLPATLDSSDGFGPEIDIRVRVLEQPADQQPEDDWTCSYEWVAERNDDGTARRLVVIEAPRRHAQDPALARRAQSLVEHTADVERWVRDIARRLKLPAQWVDTLAVAARLHDQGKRRVQWQDAMGTPRTGRPYAKSASRSVDIALLDRYRHEFGSLAHAAEVNGFAALAPEWQDLALHLVASHHGGARPLIEARDPDAPPSALSARASEVSLRFARLQRRWGPWGLAWWEALLRAADMQASAEANENKDGR